MAGKAVIRVIGTLVRVGLATPDQAPDQDEHQTVVRIAAGLSMVDSDTTGGNQPGIHLYDTVGRSIGSTPGSKTTIRDGSFEDISVPFDRGVGYKPTEYLSVAASGGNDALCIAYIAIAQPDGDKKVWYGDVAKTCGADWYHSQLKTGDDDYQPACIWIDRDHSYGLRFQGLGLHINDFAATKERTDQYNDNTDLMCKAAPRLKMYERMSDNDPIPYFSPALEYNATGLTDIDPAVVLDKNTWALRSKGPNINKAVVDADPPSPRRLLRRQRPQQRGLWSWLENHLIVSNSTHHSAKELCESSGSVGPDFVSVPEQLFCDMEHKRTWQLCGANKTGGCFDTTSHAIKTGNGTSNTTSKVVEELAVKIESELIKAYEKIIHWT